MENIVYKIFLILILFFVPSISFAGYYQEEQDTITTGGIYYFSSRITASSTFDGTLYSVAWKMQNEYVADTNFSAIVYGYTGPMVTAGAPSSKCASQQTKTLSALGGPQILNFQSWTQYSWPANVNLGTPCILSPTLMYSFLIQNNSGPFQYYHMYGSSASTSPSVRVDNSFMSGGTQYPMFDPFLNVQLVESPSLLYSRISAQNPLPNATTSSPVGFNFQYYINGSEYDKAGFEMAQYGASQPNIDTSAYEISVTSGSSFYSRAVSLNTQQSYLWRPYLKNSSTGNYLYGLYATFFVTATSGGTPTNWTDLVASTSLLQGFSNSASATDNEFTQLGKAAVVQITFKRPFDYVLDMPILLSDFSRGFGAGSVAVLSYTYSYMQASTTVTMDLSLASLNGTPMKNTLLALRQYMVYLLYFVSVFGFISVVRWTLR